MIPLGLAMRRARQMRRMSQRAVAQAMGTTQSTVSEYEVGASIPNATTLRRWADAVGMVMHVSFTPAELVDDGAWPWQPKGSPGDTSFGYGEVEES